MLAQQESSLLLPMVSFSGLPYPGSVLPVPPPFPLLLSSTSHPCSLRQDSSWGGGVGIRVASFPPGSHWSAGLLTWPWLVAPISVFPSDRLGSLSAVCRLDTSITRRVKPRPVIENPPKYDSPGYHTPPSQSLRSIIPRRVNKKSSKT